MEAIKAFEGDLTTLAPSDQYFNEVRLLPSHLLFLLTTEGQIMVIPRLGERLQCMITRRRLEMDMEELKPELSILRCAADELKNSIKFKKLLGVSHIVPRRWDETDEVCRLSWRLEIL